MAATTVPGYYNFATDVVDRWAALDPSHRAMVHVSRDNVRREVTFGDFSRRSHAAAVVLQRLGVRKGDVVLLVMHRLVAWWELFLAIVRLGAIPAPCTTLLVPKDLKYRCEKAQARAFVGDTEAAMKIESIGRGGSKIVDGLIRIHVSDDDSATASVARVKEECLDGWHSYDVLMAQQPINVRCTASRTQSTDPGLLYFTSGTTGNPKAVLHTQASYGLGHGAATGAFWLQLSRKSLYWNLSEQGWAKAGWSVCAAWLNGAALFVADQRGAFDPALLLRTLHEHDVTVLCAAPTIYRQLCTRASLAALAGRPPRALVHCCGAGEPLNANVIDTWRSATGMTIRDAFGQTETICVCANGKDVDVRPGSMGVATPGITLAIIDANGNEVEYGTEGDVAIVTRYKDAKTGQWINTDQFIFKGYWDPATDTLTRPSRRSPAPVTVASRSSSGSGGSGGAKWSEREYYPTGDRATMDNSGYLWFVGRDDDVINSAGYRIGPFEVESALREHPAVVESAAVGSPDPARDLIVKAFVVLTSEARQALDAPSDARTNDAAAAGQMRAEREAQLVKELQAHVKRTAAPYKYPREVEFVAELPKTVSGKIRRNVLRDRERERKRALLDAAAAAASKKDAKARL